MDKITIRANAGRILDAMRELEIPFLGMSHQVSPSLESKLFATVRIDFERRDDGTSYFNIKLKFGDAFHRRIFEKHVSVNFDGVIDPPHCSNWSLTCLIERTLSYIDMVPCSEEVFAELRLAFGIATEQAKRNWSLIAGHVNTQGKK